MVSSVRILCLNKTVGMRTRTQNPGGQLAARQGHLSSGRKHQTEWQKPVRKSIGRQRWNGIGAVDRSLYPTIKNGNKRGQRESLLSKRYWPNHVTNIRLLGIRLTKVDSQSRSHLAYQRSLRFKPEVLSAMIRPSAHWTCSTSPSLTTHWIPSHSNMAERA